MSTSEVLFLDAAKSSNTKIRIFLKFFREVFSGSFFGKFFREVFSGSFFKDFYDFKDDFKEDFKEDFLEDFFKDI